MTSSQTFFPSFSSQPTNDEVPTPTTVQNNNVPTSTSDINADIDAAVDDREKRDKSTEKQIVADVNDNDDDDALIVDSLENLKSKVDSEVEVKDFDDEGLGDINHGSEASRYVGLLQLLILPFQVSKLEGVGLDSSASIDFDAASLI